MALQFGKVVEMWGFSGLSCFRLGYRLPVGLKGLCAGGFGAAGWGGGPQLFIVATPQVHLELSELARRKDAGGRVLVGSSIKVLPKFYQSPLNDLSKFYQSSIKVLSKFYQSSIKVL